MEHPGGPIREKRIGMKDSSVHSVKADPGDWRGKQVSYPAFSLFIGSEHPLEVGYGAIRPAIPEDFLI